MLIIAFKKKKLSISIVSLILSPMYLMCLFFLIKIFQADGFVFGMMMLGITIWLFAIINYLKLNK